MPLGRARSVSATSQENLGRRGLSRQELADWCKAEGDWDLEVVERDPGRRGFSIQPRRWMVERTFGWLSRNRRLSKEYERKVQTSESLIQVAMIRLLRRSKLVAAEIALAVLEKIQDYGAAPLGLGRAAQLLSAAWPL